MLNLTDTVEIIIIITVFSTLMLMITCILYKLSKLHEVMDTQTTMPASASLISVGLPWRRESSHASECSICQLENGHCLNNAKPSDIPLRNTTRQKESVVSKSHEETRQNRTDQEERVFTGRLTLTIEYKASDQSLVLKRVTADDLFPWDYSSVTQTFVAIESQVGITYDKQSSEVETGVHRVFYDHNFEFNVCDTDLDQTQFVLSVWQHEESGDDNLIGECTVAMETLKITTAPGKSLEVSEKLFKKLSKAYGIKMGTNWGKSMAEFDSIPDEKKYYKAVYFNVMKVVRYLTDRQYFNYMSRAAQPTEDRDVPIPGRKRADTWPKSSNETKMDGRMVGRI